MLSAAPQTSPFEVMLSPLTEPGAVKVEGGMRDNVETNKGDRPLRRFLQLVNPNGEILWSWMRLTLQGPIKLNAPSSLLGFPPAVAAFAPH